ncbi:hypothetical protein [Frigoribacterium sp. CFBP 8751]|jgi:hypothetical protein|uniref:hypothetical protein n=1 Tax=Frigoribacterium sp. CFBP 8751 TaxID=2775277 RepID=UPI0017803BF1|nr:hypothetical protein [Frigoribacterium sp. CFBP 8751]MBD8539586.1 hypothetical protein [Frigoribacterium sp. CFBP 8751]
MSTYETNPFARPAVIHTYPKPGISRAHRVSIGLTGIDRSSSAYRLPAYEDFFLPRPAHDGMSSRGGTW